MNKKDREKFEFYRRFGPYERDYTETSDMRVMWYIIVNGKKVPVSSKVYAALCQVGLIKK